MSAELALSILSLVLALATLGIVLTLLGRKELDYATRREHLKLDKRVTEEFGRLQYSLSLLYRYVEVVDDHTGAGGYRVLSKRMSRDNTKA